MKICGHRLLVVEDEPLLRITMADALRKEGWTVDVAEDGVKAVALFEQHLHDLVLTDLVMPNMTGIELYETVRQRDGKLAERMIFFSGGVLDEVLGRLAEHLERSRALRETVVSALIYPAILLGVALPAAANWPQWGGPNRNFKVEAHGLADTWPEQGPNKVWSRDLGDTLRITPSFLDSFAKALGW